MKRAPSIERRALGLVGEARLAIGDYGARVVADAEIEELLGVFNATYAIGDMGGMPAILFPPILGKYRIAIDAAAPRAARRYILLHELGHILAGEGDEPMEMRFSGPLPESEDVCDLFSLVGIVDEAHILEGGEWLEQQIRQAVPIDDYGWQTYRIPRLAKKLPRVRELVRDLHGYY